MHNPFHDNGAACTYIYILTHMYDTFIDFKNTYLLLFLGIFTKNFLRLTTNFDIISIGDNYQK